MFRNNKGFTLVEVLVAFTILSVSVGVILVAFSGGLRNSGLSRSYTHAVIIAESRLAETGVSEELSEENEMEGSDGKYRWKKIIRSYGYPVGEWQLYQVSVIVSWQDFSRARSFSLESLRWGKSFG